MLAYGPISEVTRRMNETSHPTPPGTDQPQPALPAGTAARSFKLRTLGPAEPARLLLEGMLGISSVQAVGDQLTFRADAGDPALAEAVKKLATGGVGVVGLEPERDQLETMFLHLTKKDAP